MDLFNNNIIKKQDWLEILFVMAALCNRAAIIFLPFGFYLSSSPFFLFSSPNPSGRRLDVYHTSAHGVALVRI